MWKSTKTIEEIAQKMNDRKKHLEHTLGIWIHTITWHKWIWVCQSSDFVTLIQDKEWNVYEKWMENEWIKIKA